MYDEQACNRLDKCPVIASSCDGHLSLARGGRPGDAVALDSVVARRLVDWWWWRLFVIFAAVWFAVPDWAHCALSLDVHYDNDGSVFDYKSMSRSYVTVRRLGSKLEESEWRLNR